MRTRSFEEAVRIQSSLAAPIKLEPAQRRMEFSWDANRIALGRLGLMASQYGDAVRARSMALSRQFSFVLPVRKGGTVEQEGTVVEMMAGQRAIMCSPAWPTEFLLDSDFESRALAIPPEVAERTLDALTGVTRATALRFELSVDMSRAGAALQRLLEFVVSEADQEESVLSSPLVVSRLEDALICALLTGLPHNHSHLFDSIAKAVEPGYVRRAQEYIDANAHRHISLTELAAATGVAIRTLTAAFRKHRGYSPMGFLRERRFELARKQFLASASSSVTVVALSCGFEHLGRFSAGYRARFGESPTDTLRRANGLARGQRRPQ